MGCLDISLNENGMSICFSSRNTSQKFFLLNRAPEDFSVEENVDSHSVVLMSFDGGDGLSDSDSDSPPTSSHSPKRRRLLHKQGQQEVPRRQPHEIKTKLARLLEAAAGSTAREAIQLKKLGLSFGLKNRLRFHFDSV